MLLGLFIRMGAAILFGAAIGAIIYKVYTIVTSSNLAEIVRSAIQNAESDIVRKLLGRSLKIIVKEKSVNTISISVLEADLEKMDDVQIRIESTEGVEDSIYEGMIQNILT